MIKLADVVISCSGVLTGQCLAGFRYPEYIGFLNNKTTFQVLKSRLVVRTKGLEPLSHCWHQPLKLARIPIPPRPHKISRQTILGSWGLGKKEKIV
jgi:hypothetical protein